MPLNTSSFEVHQTKMFSYALQREPNWKAITNTEKEITRLSGDMKHVTAAISVLEVALQDFVIQNRSLSGLIGSITDDMQRLPLRDDRRTGPTSQPGAEINRPREVLASLQQRRDELREFIHQEESLIPPITKIPEDVLRYIFTLCQLHFEDGFVNSCNPKTFVRTITSVCTYWRSVAHSSPELWSSINISPESAQTIMSPVGLGSFVETCISLSGRHPLHIKFGNECTSTLLGNNCVQRIAGCADRWMEIDFSNAVLLDDILSHISSEVVLSSLERLHIRKVNHTVSLNPSPKLSYLFAQYGRDGYKTSLKYAPRLQNCGIASIFHPMSLFVDFPWDQITTFEVIHVGFANGELSSLLKSMPNLTSLKIRLDLHPNAAPQNPVSLPSLKTFKFQQDGTYTGLDVYTARNIDTLHLGSGSVSPSILNFLNRSRSCLLNFQLTITPLDETWFTRSSYLRTVKKLGLCYRNNIRELQNDLRILTREVSSGHPRHPSYLVFPQLQSLEISAGQWEQGPTLFTRIILDIINMLKSRITPIRRDSATEGRGDDTMCFLKEVNIRLSYYPTREEMITLRKFNSSDIVHQTGLKMRWNLE